MAESYSVEAYLKAVGVDKFGRDFRNATKDVEGLERSTNKAGLTIGKLVAAVGITAAVAKGFNMIKESVNTAFKRIDTMEQFSSVMNVMVGDTERVNAALERTREAVTGTAYTLDNAASSVQGFVTRGIEVEKAVGYIESWGNAVAFYGDGSNESFANVTEALQNMVAKGKVGMDQLNRVTQAGIPAVELYADAVGMSSADVQDALSKGEISAEQFVDTVTKAMNEGGTRFPAIANAAKEAGASWGATWGNMRTHVATGVQSIIENIDAMLSENSLPSVREMIKKFGETFRDNLKRVGEAIPPAVEKIKEIYNNLKPWLPLIKTATIVIGAFVTAFAGVNTAISLATKAMGAFNVVMALNPWVLLAAAIVATVALIYVYWEPIKEFFIKLWESIKEVGLAIWEPLQSAWSSAVDAVISIWQTIVGFFNDLWQSVKDTFTTAWDNIVNVVIAIVSPFVDGIKNIFNNMKDGLTTILDGLKKYFSGVWELIKNIFLGAVLLILNLVTGNFEELKSNAKAIFENIKSALSDIWEGIKKVFSGALQAIWGYVKGAWENIKSNTSAIFNNVKSIILTIWNGIKSFFTETLVNIWNTVKQKFSDMFNSVREKMDETKAKVEEVWNSVVSFLKGIDLFEIGADILRGLINGIGSMAQAVWDKAKSIADGIGDTIKKALGIASPSKVTIQLAKWTGEGIVIGLEKMRRFVERASDRLAIAAIPDIPQVDINSSGLNHHSNHNQVNNNPHRTSSGGGITQNITINSPEPTSPSENARKMKQASRQLALEWGV